MEETDTKSIDYIDYHKIIRVSFRFCALFSVHVLPRVAVPGLSETSIVIALFPAFAQNSFYSHHILLFSLIWYYVTHLHLQIDYTDHNLTNILGNFTPPINTHRTWSGSFTSLGLCWRLQHPLPLPRVSYAGALRHTRPHPCARHQPCDVQEISL